MRGVLTSSLRVTNSRTRHGSPTMFNLRFIRYFPFPLFGINKNRWRLYWSVFTSRQRMCEVQERVVAEAIRRGKVNERMDDFTTLHLWPITGAWYKHQCNECQILYFNIYYSMQSFFFNVCWIQGFNLIHYELIGWTKNTPQLNQIKN
jgi:hypothetical protein